MENRNADVANQTPETTLPEKLLEKLLEFDPVEAPVISLYLDARADQHGQQNFPSIREEAVNQPHQVLRQSVRRTNES